MKLKLHSQILNISIGYITSRTQEYRSCFHGVTNVSIPEVNMLKNSSTLAVSVPINIFIKFGVVSANGPRETYFMDALHRLNFAHSRFFILIRDPYDKL